MSFYVILQWESMVNLLSLLDNKAVIAHPVIAAIAPYIYTHIVSRTLWGIIGAVFILYEILSRSWIWVEIGPF